ncbi:MAG: hypothetical protein HYU87_10475 [Chloroflexi bacterium]|nr:hypothetical protein [Chloroflexota bacterium]
MRAPVGVALLGLGTVGSAVAHAMGERAKRLEAAAGRPLQLTGAAVRDTTKPRATDVAVTANAFDLLDDPAVDVVVEVMGGHRPAIDLHLAAFERGKHVVTANKEVVAREWRALHEAARSARRELRFEAAVAAAIPIVAAARALGAVRPRVLSGLLNGTTTYICSRMEAGGTFDAASRSCSACSRDGGSRRTRSRARRCEVSRPSWCRMHRLAARASGIWRSPASASARRRRASRRKRWRRPRWKDRRQGRRTSCGSRRTSPDRSRSWDRAPVATRPRAPYSAT